MDHFTAILRPEQWNCVSWNLYTRHFLKNILQKNIVPKKDSECIIMQEKLNIKKTLFMIKLTILHHFLKIDQRIKGLK